MARQADISFRVLATWLSILAFCPAGRAQPKKEPVDYVNPNIGGIGQTLTATFPIVKLPAGMASAAPITTPGITDRYLADRVYGFPAGAVTFMPLAGLAGIDMTRNASLYDHDLETATPYYYRAILEDSDIEVEYTVSARALYYRIAFPEGAKAHILLGVPADGEIKLSSPSTFSGHSSAGGRIGRYFYAEFSKPVASSNQVAGLQLPQDRRQLGGGAGAGIMADFTPDRGEQIGMRLGFR